MLGVPDPFCLVFLRLQCFLSEWVTPCVEIPDFFLALRCFCSKEHRVLPYLGLSCKEQRPRACGLAHQASPLSGCRNLWAPQQLCSGVLPGGVLAPWGGAPSCSGPPCLLCQRLWGLLGHVGLEEAAGPASTKISTISTQRMTTVLMVEILAVRLSALVYTIFQNCPSSFIIWYLWQVGTYPEFVT